MTGNAFIKRLLIGLDFLSDDDKKIVIGFYEKKLSAADTLTDEEAIVKSFGSPEHIAIKLKETYDRFQSSDKENSDSEDANTEGSSPSSDTLSAPEEITEKEDLTKENEKEEEKNSDQAAKPEDDLIFSRPMHDTPAPEVIHSLENQDVKTLYGEKVEMESETIESIEIDENDLVNGLTPEEIEHAKAETLEKASHYDDEISAEENVLPNRGSEGKPIEECETKSLVDDKPKQPKVRDDDDVENEREVLVSDCESALEFYEDELPMSEEKLNEDAEIEPSLVEDENSGEKEGETISVQKAPCLIARLFPSLSEKASVAATILLSFLFSPLLILCLGLPVLLHLACCAVVVFTAVLLFAVMVALVAIGILELIYGFSLFGTAISIALVELGMGLILLAIVTAITALIYEYLFALVPKCIKWLAHLLKRGLKGMCKFLYGGKK